MFEDTKPMIVLAEPHPDLVLQWHRLLESVGHVRSFTALGAAHQQGYLRGRAKGVDLVVVNMTVQLDCDGLDLVDRYWNNPKRVIPCVLYGTSDLPVRMRGAVASGVVRFRRKREYCENPMLLLTDVTELLALPV